MLSSVPFPCSLTAALLPDAGLPNTTPECHPTRAFILGNFLEDGSARVKQDEATVLPTVLGAVLTLYQIEKG